MVVQGFYRIVERKSEQLNHRSQRFGRYEFTHVLNYVLETITKANTEDLKSFARALERILDARVVSEAETNIFNGIDNHFADSLAKDLQIVKPITSLLWTGYGVLTFQRLCRSGNADLPRKVSLTTEEHSWKRQLTGR